MTSRNQEFAAGQFQVDYEIMYNREKSEKIEFGF